jgi:DNA-binding transcriptional LysR family regulator
VSVELRHLRAFVAVAEELNFTRAAARLHLAQQALSTQIRQLEQLVGVQLFSRTTRKVELTAAGHALLERIPELLAGIDGALDAAAGAGRGDTGELSVGLLATAPLDFTPRLLRAFAGARPGVTLSVRNYPFDDPSGGLQDHRTDVALVWTPFTTDGLVCEGLSRIRGWPCSPPTTRSPSEPTCGRRIWWTSRSSGSRTWIRSRATSGRWRTTAPASPGSALT